jgi:hypothetical protein
MGVTPIMSQEPMLETWESDFMDDAIDYFLLDVVSYTSCNIQKMMSNLSQSDAMYLSHRLRAGPDWQTHCPCRM